MNTIPADGARFWSRGLALFALGAMVAGSQSVGCGGDSQNAGGGGNGSTGGGGASGGGGANGGGSASGLPCTLGAMLERSCASCHGDPLTNGAPMPLRSYEDLIAPGLSDASRTVAEISVERMKNASAPMPPAGVVASQEIALLEDWIAAGSKRQTCDEGGIKVVCTSGTYWSHGDSGSRRMHPGQACIDCHTSRKEGPSFTLAGTVYPTLREPDDCNGVVPGGDPVIIQVTDANDVVVELKPNEAGNFTSTVAVAFPINAQVLYQGRILIMSGEVNSGDCNSCHTESGINGAPGRIFLP